MQKNKMKPKNLSIAVIAVIGIIILSGCIGEKEPAPTQPQTPEQPTPAPDEPEVKELSTAEIVEKTKTAIDGTNTYEFESKDTITTGGTPQEETISGKVDRINKKKYGIDSYFEEALEEDVKTENYVTGGIKYTYAAQVAWVKSETGWADEDILIDAKNLLNSANSHELTEVDGKDAYLFILTPDKSIFKENFIVLSIINEGDVDELIEMAESAEVKMWISKETFLPLKIYGTVDTKLKGEPMKVELVTEFKNYNKPQDIQLPKEAESAEDVTKDEVIENPEEVVKAMDAIESVTSYKAVMEKKVTGPSAGEETYEIEASRINKKLINTNKWAEEGEDVSLTFYTIDDTTYVQEPVSEMWLKYETTWGEEDFLDVIKNLLKTTEVEVTEENNDFIFDVKTNKDIFGTDFGEIAQDAGDPETAVDELILNAKDVVVKIRVSKDTLLPVKQTMSVESKQYGSKMTISKEMIFREYDEPVTITLPADAEDAIDFDEL